MAPIQISPTAVALATRERAIAAGQVRAQGCSAPGGDLIVLDQRARNQTAGDDSPAVRLDGLEATRRIAAHPELSDIEGAAA
jgi:hypothetical protein